LLLGGAIAGTLVIGGTAGLGPAVRSRVAQLAARRGLVVHIGAVRPAWFGARLLDVSVTSERTAGIQATLPELRVDVGLTLHPTALTVVGGTVVLQGSPEELRSALENPAAAAGTASGHISLRASGLSGSWRDGTRRAEWEGLAIRRDDKSTELSASHVSAHVDAAGFVLDDAHVSLAPGEVLTGLHAAAATVAWSRSTPAMDDSPAPAPAVDKAVPGDGDAEPALLPDPQALHARLVGAAKLVAGRIPSGTEIGIEKLTWAIGGEPETTFTVGPGPLVVRRTPDEIELQYSSGASAGASMNAHARIPTDGGDLSITLDGGPVALAALGVHEGAAGLFEVGRATVGGRATVHLAGDGSALTFDFDTTARDLSIRQPSLATEPVRHLDLQLSARGALEDAGALRLDDFGVTVGLFHVAGSGVVERHPDHDVASLRFELPSAACQSLLDSIPTALLPVLGGTRWTGTFGARGRFAFDTRDPDALELVYDVQDQCRAVEVPAPLARGRFKQPFQHTVYMPDGSLTDQTTGPGTSNWTALPDISPFMQVAVMTTEDGAFPNHHGFNVSAIKASIIANIKARRFVRGASTITMQLAKNLFLSRQKTLSRKLEEVVLTDYLEQVFSKDEIMELYLNVVEFGPAVYGITAASEYYFGRTPAELNVAESLFLSSLLPSPRRYGAMRELAEAPDGWMRGLRNLMRIAHKRHLLGDADYEEAIEEKVVFWHGGVKPPPRPPARARSPLEGTDTADGDAPVEGP
jgi:hypothetical protein